MTTSDHRAPGRWSAYGPGWSSLASNSRVVRVTILLKGVVESVSAVWVSLPRKLNGVDHVPCDVPQQ